MRIKTQFPGSSPIHIIQDFKENGLLENCDWYEIKINFRYFLAPGIFHQYGEWSYNEHKQKPEDHNYFWRLDLKYVVLIKF